MALWVFVSAVILQDIGIASLILHIYFQTSVATFTFQNGTTTSLVASTKIYTAMEKNDTVNHLERPSSVDGPRKDYPLTEEVIGYEATFDELPKGYYTSRFFLGSMLATSFGLWAGTCAFVSKPPPPPRDG